MTPPERPFNVATIFDQSFKEYVHQHGPLPAQHYKVANAIMTCRTEPLGGHVYCCRDCEQELTLYNSCRNRHCPRCQAMARAIWVQDRVDEILPTPYFHVVFTLPHELNPYALRNKAVFYALMFKAVSETLCQLGRDSRRLGGMIGAITVLHTWGQNLMDHPHIHCIVPAGALSADRDRWIPCSKDFLFPVAVMRKLYRGKFLALFAQALSQGRIRHFENASAQFPAREALMAKLRAKDWVVYVKKPFATPVAVIKYLGRYTHRIAIADSRIRKIDRDGVHFSHKDYAQHNLCTTMKLSTTEFIRRFLLHVIPKGFMRIRSYGFLCNRLKKDMIPLCRELIGAALKTMPLTAPVKIFERWSPQCPECGRKQMYVLREVFAKTGSLSNGAIA